MLNSSFPLLMYPNQSSEWYILDRMVIASRHMEVLHLIVLSQSDVVWRDHSE